jgi:hypothetical protein
VVALFKREYILTVDTLRITQLDISFNINRTLSREPNTAEISIRNLTESNRKRLEESAEVPVVLEAGYQQPQNAVVFGLNNTFASSMSAIFNGDLREIFTERDGPDLVTKVTSGDGEKRKRRARINKGFAPGTTLRTVIEALANAMGVGLGNIRRISNPSFLNAGATFPSGTTASGDAGEVLGQILRSAGLTYSIQDGELQILSLTTALDAAAVVLNSGSGLIETPSIASDGTMRARTLMIPDLFPGRKVQFDSDAVTGFGRVETAEYVGDTAGSDWFIDIECKGIPQ